MAESFNTLQGQLLLDGGKLRGSFFHRTVVLICQHDANGAFGLVLNRPSGKPVGEMIESELPEPIQKEPLYLGGPVQPAALSYLHTDHFLLNANVMANVSLGHSIESLSEIGESFSEGQCVRIFAGYAGWSGGQLEDEMRRGSWLVHAASVDLVFHVKPEEIWHRILRDKGWKYRLAAQAPEDLSWN